MGGINEIMPGPTMATNNDRYLAAIAGDNRPHGHSPGSVEGQARGGPLLQKGSPFAAEAGNYRLKAKLPGVEVYGMPLGRNIDVIA
jgi:hypothetical protein